MDFYDPTPDPNLLSQGDIIRDFIFIDPPEQIFLVRDPPATVVNNENLSPETVVQLKRVERQSSVADAFHDGKEAVVVDALLANVAIISQSCDIDRKSFLTVATVRPISFIGNAEKQQTVRSQSHKVFGTFWLPGVENVLAESYVDLSLIFSVRREVLVHKINDRILGLLPEPRQRLQWSIIQHFGRPA